MEKHNNYRAANELEKFHQKYIKPLQKRIVEADKIFKDDKFAWKPGQKEKSLEAYEILQAEFMDYSQLYDEVYRLIAHHENLTTMLTELYMRWYNNVSNKGSQPKEMMSVQAKMLEEIFEKIRESFESVKDFQLPKKEEQ